MKIIIVTNNRVYSCVPSCNRFTKNEKNLSLTIFFLKPIIYVYYSLIWVKRVQFFSV